MYLYDDIYIDKFMKMLTNFVFILKRALAPFL